MDEWRPAASIEVSKLRARLLGRVRDFFSRHGVLDVDTPILSTAGTTDPHLHSFRAGSLAPGSDCPPHYLHTSPEFAMKRLLAAGSGSIYQICKVFRAGEAGRLHNPEFTMIEWYRVGMGYQTLMDEVAALVTEMLVGLRRLAPAERLSYRDAFLHHTGLDPHRASARDFRGVAEARGVSVSGLAGDDRDAWRDLLLTHFVEPHLGRGRLTFLYDYPASAAALARIRAEDPPVAERFELYLDGIELANGFQELTDAAEQRGRFERDRTARRELGLADIPMDERLVAALAHGLPECSGVALGFDRLVMLAAEAATISEVLAFPSDRA